MSSNTNDIRQMMLTLPIIDPKIEPIVLLPPVIYVTTIYLITFAY